MKITEENLIQQLNNRNSKAIEYLINNYAKSMYALATRILGGIVHSEEIEECVSEVFASVWENTHRYDEEKGSVKTWLLVLTKYCALNYRRKALKNMETEELQEGDFLQETVESEIVSKESMREILSAINELPEVDRSIFYRRYFLYESIESIAQRLKMTRSAVDTRLWRGRNILKVKLSRIQREG